MKSDIRILGIDDAPFKFEKEKKKIPLVGVMMRGNSYVEGVLIDEITVDGADANAVLKKMINKSHYKEQMRAIMVDGAAVGGFNVVDIDKLYEDTKIPVITITRKKPDFEAIKKALQAHFDSWEERFGILTQCELATIKTSHNPLYVKYAGMDKNEVKNLITISIKIGAMPEPLRVAHLIATAIIKKESYGRA